MRPASSLCRLAALIALLLAAGCATDGPFGLSGAIGERVTRVDHFPAYSPGTFSAFAAAGPLVEVQGPLPGGASPDEIAAALRMPGFWPQAPFKAVAPGEAAGMQRIVIGFGAAAGVNPPFACEGQPAGGGVTDRLVAAAVYCIGRSPASAAHLSRRDLPTPDSPVFGDAFARLFMALAPRRDPDRDDARGFLFLRGE